VLNVLTGERYKSISKETAGVLKGEYGATAAPKNAELQARVLDGADEITCRPADLIGDEFDALSSELQALAKEKGIELSENVEDDVLTYALFPQIGLKFLENRNNPDAFEPHPDNEVAPESAPAATAPAQSGGVESYSVRVNGQAYQVEVGPGGEISDIQVAAAPVAAAPAPVAGGEPLAAPLAGNIFKILVSPGQQVAAGEVVMILEAMKMETEVRAVNAGVVGQVSVKEGDSVTVGQTLLTL
ncbi:MAG: biotin/lipoyl-containing protein, partial [Psychrobium sp.]